MWFNSLIPAGLMLLVLAPRAPHPTSTIPDAAAPARAATEGHDADTAALAPPAVAIPQFSLEPKDNRNKVKVTYSTNSSQIIIKRFRLMANGNPDPDSEHKWTKPNTGSFLDDPEPPSWASPATFQYTVRAKDPLSPWSQPKYIHNIH